MCKCKCFLSGLGIGMAAGAAVGMLVCDKPKKTNSIARIAEDIIDFFK